MARFSEQFILQVQQATDIVELISQYVALKRRGKEFLGVCPFHDDKRPSMNVSPTKQIFKCFACGAGGAAFNFLMLYEKMTFPEAVRSLADRANIPLPQDGQPAQQIAPGMGKADLAEVTKLAMDFYRHSLHIPAGEQCLAYARDRGFTDESIERFAIGYAPDQWEGFIQAARKRGFTDNQLVSSGMAARRDNGGCYDRFRNRLMFPIIDPSGRVVGFGGRALSAEERAKYLNSPESPLFDKSSQLFGLNWSREQIVSSGQAIVVEGYLDVLIPLQAGVGNVVATLGTALTERHVRILARYAKEVVLIFDADAAGAAAAERALEVFLAQQVHVRVATIPAGKDPCDYCLAEGADGLRTLVAGAPDALSYAWNCRRNELAAVGGNLADRRRVVEEFLRLVVASSAYGAIDEVRRGQLAQHIAHVLNISAGELQQLMRKMLRQVRNPHADAPTPNGSAYDLGLLVERHVLEVLLNQPDLFDSAAERIDPRDFTEGDLRVVAEVVWRLNAEGRGELENILACESLAQYGALVADLATAGERRGELENTLAGAVEKMLYRRNRLEMKGIGADGVDQDEALRRIAQRPLSDVHRRPTIN